MVQELFGNEKRGYDMSNTIPLTAKQRSFLLRIRNESLFYNDYEVLKHTLRHDKYKKGDRDVLNSLVNMFLEEIVILK